MWPHLSHDEEQSRAEHDDADDLYPAGEQVGRLAGGSDGRLAGALRSAAKPSLVAVVVTASAASPTISRCAP